MSGASDRARARSNSWTRAEEEALIGTWHRGAEAAAHAVSEVSRSEGGPPRSESSCAARVAFLRAQGDEIAAMSARDRGRLSAKNKGTRDSPSRYYRPGQDPAARAAAAARGKRRKCLRCRDVFTSEGPGNHVCRDCKKDPAWHDGQDADLCVRL